MPVMNLLWLPAPPHPTLHPDEVHVWGAALVQPPAVEALLAAALSADEIARANRFHFARDRQHYITGRGILRHLLAHYGGTHAAAIQFRYNPQGKPALENEAALQFNLSNSGDVALIALTLRRRIGVDIEYRRTLTDLLALARSNFSPNEFQQLAALPDHAQAGAFFNCWTRKEAYIKAIGDGLSHPLDSFDVAFVPGAVPQFVRISGDEPGVTRWSLRALTPHPDYTGALAVDGPISRLSCWQWQMDA